ncbi:MAG: hypothetical protein E7177_01840 [Erysipelotrichaceae bacterium]|nr:hypothetical protein [Erysipelotrichaceae bacterium]
MKIGIYKIVSSLHDQNIIDVNTKVFISSIEEELGKSFSFINKEQIKDFDLVLVLIQSGGSENQFKKIYKELPKPYLLLTYGSNNSLAASMEILSFLHNNRLEGEILHGSTSYIVKRIKHHLDSKKKVYHRLGVIGRPSDWLISSNVDYNYVKEKLGIELVNISLNELIDNYKNVEGDKIEFDSSFSKVEVDKALDLHKALVKIKEDYSLNGLTLRCFSLLNKIKTTGCLGLALLNKEGITATCEGDIPTMLSMHICNMVMGNPGFQANPSRIDLEKNEIVFAHCTIPLNMISSPRFMTHFESGIGVALRGDLDLTKVTIFKLGSDLKSYFVETGEIVENLQEDNLCRTQIKIKMDNLESFLTNPKGNHHVIIYGDHKKALIDFLEK